MTDGIIVVAVYTDGMGTFQARCMECAHRGPWRRRQARAADDAAEHGGTHENDDFAG